MIINDESLIQQKSEVIKDILVSLDINVKRDYSNNINNSIYVEEKST